MQACEDRSTLTKKWYEAACDYSDALDRLSVRAARDNFGPLYEKVELARKLAERARAALELYLGANT
jgi:hypothetical protein